MRSRVLSFADAVRLLGGDSELVERLGQVAGAGAGAATAATLSAVDFFALRDQVVRWGHAAVRGWHDRVSGLGRYDRTDRIVAAHSVIVIVAFYEALDEWLAARGADLDRAGLSAAEQAALAGGQDLARSYSAMVDALVRRPAPHPTPRLPFEALTADLAEFYRAAAETVTGFLGGLAAYERIDFTGCPAEVSVRAVRRYREAYRRLAAEIPEFRLWSEMVDAQATREVVREAVDALRADHEGTRDALARLYTAHLERPILSSAEAPGDLVLPTLRDGYLEPSGVVAAAGAADLPATEMWWSARGSPVPAVQDFLLACLTTPEATELPVVVLGQPGSGKSVLTRVLAARLSGADFLPVRVELRSVRADSPVQTQIEEALFLLLGEQLSWPALVRRAGTALPVVMMDGFDELLQATGQNWADYLERLQEFQQREAELGRPLAILVTSRTVVADRVRFPAETTVVRLDPFGEAQITRWLDVWNRVNGPRLLARGLRPLPAEVVLDHLELANQPLLLLLLSLYDGRANGLQRHGGGLGSVELYERLFADFFERQVDKFGGRLSPDQRENEVAAEWRRLSAVAVAMHNRGRDVILEPELESDVRHLLRDEDRTAGPGGSGRTLTVGQLLVGRFFFVHESRASRDTGAAERSFEFLHATFGDFLTARQVVEALVDLAEDRAHLRRRPGSSLDAGFFHALTSFATVTRRGPLWEFCQGLIARLDAGTRRGCRELVLHLLPEAGYPHPTWSLAGYEPERRTLAERQAAFTANLVSLAVLLSDGPVDVAELVGEPMVIRWRQQAMLWMSQLDPEDGRSLWQSFRVQWDPRVNPADLTVRLEDGADIGVLTSLPWPPQDRPFSAPGDWSWHDLIGGPQDVTVPSETPTGGVLRKSAFVQTGFDTRELMYALVPFWRRFGDLHYYVSPTKLYSDAFTLFEALLGGLETDMTYLSQHIAILHLVSPEVSSYLMEDLLTGRLAADRRFDKLRGRDEAGDGAPVRGTGSGEIGEEFGGERP